jgi:hypothetical protein
MAPVECSIIAGCIRGYNSNRVREVASCYTQIAGVVLRRNYTGADEMKHSEIEIPILAVTLKMSGRVTVPPIGERTMRLCAKSGEFPTFQIGNSSRQYVLIDDLRDWMKGKTI